MKKIGIMTFHRAINYGALLQCYALQETLKARGADASVVDYRCPFVDNAYRLTWGLEKSKLSSWKYWLAGIPDQIRKKNAFRSFEEKYLNLTPAYTKDTIAQSAGTLDAFVTGSDQVWNMKVCGGEKAYLLDFLKDPSQKYSYAVSLGGYEMTPEETALAKDFSLISMREESACDYIEKNTGNRTHQDLDPTLLLKKEDWEKLVTEPEGVKKPYILIYSVHPQNHMVEYAKKLAAEKGLEIYHLHNRIKKELVNEKVNVIFDRSPEQFLSLIHGAEYVVTNSFHGTVFSIIFQKKFLSELTTKGGFNNRVWELLSTLGIQTRILDFVPGINDGVSIDDAIDWKSVGEKLDALRSHSLEYVDVMVSGDTSRDIFRKPSEKKTPVKIPAAKEEKAPQPAAAAEKQAPAPQPAASAAKPSGKTILPENPAPALKNPMPAAASSVRRDDHIISSPVRKGPVMYSKIKNVQFLVALLKAHGIRHVVLSPGGRNIPINHSLEQDEDFTCYSVVDERSAAYFAIGLSQQLGKQPVAICCTSSVAASNYMPGITEAFYLGIPLLVITADRDPHMLEQMENQMINQVDMYKNFCRKCVNLPFGEAKDDLWSSQRLLNEAMLELNHHGCGPVQINIPIAGSIGVFTCDRLPDVKVIRRYDRSGDKQAWTPLVQKLKKAKRILVICGTRIPPKESEIRLMEQFAARYNCVISVEHVSNVHGEGIDDLFGAAQVMPLNTFSKEYLPDIVISLGGNFVSRLKDLLRAVPENVEHWSIREDGKVCDVFKSLTSIFECRPEEFFAYFVNAADEECKNDQVYRKSWLAYAKKAEYPDFPYSNSYAIKKLSEHIPAHSLMHLGILNATRIMEHCKLAEDVTAYSNIGAYGIDGSMSTFVGQAAVSPDRPAYLVIGDLSFFYDMNALQNRHLSSNVHILLINNSGAAEFHYFMGEALIPTINQHIAAEHFTKAEGWAKTRVSRYYAAHNKEELDQVIAEFADPAIPGPALLEVFTDKKADAEDLKAFYAKFKPADPHAALQKAAQNPQVKKLRGMLNI